MCQFSNDGHVSTDHLRVFARCVHPHPATIENNHIEHHLVGGHAPRSLACEETVSRDHQAAIHLRRQTSAWQCGCEHAGDGVGKFTLFKTIACVSRLASPLLPHGTSI